MIRLVVLSLVILVLILEVNALHHLPNGGELLYKAFKERYDICHQPLQPGNCSIGIGAWHYNHAKEKCEKFFYYSCRGNANRFLSKSDCIDICIHYRQLLTRAEIK